MQDDRPIGWRRPLLEATLITIFILGLFAYWYAAANRYTVFLYGHTTTGVRYISTASNFFAFNLIVQAFAVVVATGLAPGATGGRRWLERRGRPQPAREGDTDGAEAD